MKRTLLFLLLQLPLFIYAQHCFIGNNDTTGFDNSGDPIYMDYLLGSKIHVDSAGTLLSLNLIGRNTGAHVQMALFSQTFNAPDTLIVTSDTNTVTTVTSGVITFPVAPTLLAPGDYWIMAIYSTDSGHTYSRGQSNQVYYMSLPFGDPIPFAPSFIGYLGSEFTYFIEMDCNTTGVIEHENNSLEVYPNPFNDHLTIQSQDEFGSTYKIYDNIGRIVIEGKILTDRTVINLADITSGIYTLRIGNNRVVKIIKE